MRLGLNEAIAVQQLHFAVQTFESRVTELDGHKWLRADMQWWCEQFPWWSKATIERIWKSLRSLNVVHTSRGREANVYRIDYGQLRQIEGPDGSDCGTAAPQIEGSPCKGEENSRETGENSSGADEPPALFATASESSAPSPAAVDAPDDEADTVWAHYVKVFGDAHLRIKGLTPARSRMIEKAIKASNVEVCCAAIDGLKSYRAANPQGSKDISLDAIFATRPGGRNITDQIEFWASQAVEQRGFDLSRVPSVMRATVNSQRGLVRKGLATDDEHAQHMGREAAKWLREKFNIVPVTENGELKGWRYED